VGYVGSSTVRGVRETAGFTLVEVLLALVITGVCMGAVYGVFSAGLSANARATAQANLALEGGHFVDSMARDIRCAVFIDPSAFPDDGTAADVRCFTGAVDSVTFYTAAAAASDMPWPNARLRYYFENDAYSDTGILRVESLPTAYFVPLVDKPATDVLLDRVTDFGLRYLKEGAWTAEWNDEALPASLEVTFEIKSEDGRISRKFTRVIDIPACKAGTKQ
jgi:prepilin-type N-terminal cleavage/methylation domain-containing protein